MAFARRSRGRLTTLFTLLVWLLCAARAGAQTPADPPCTGANVLGHAASVVAPGVSEARRAVLVDGEIAPDGAVWPAPSLLVVVGEPVLYDLGEPRRIDRVFVQADADQEFDVALSETGTEWRVLSFGPDASAAGMLGRERTFRGTLARYVKIAPHESRGPLALTEVAAGCTPGQGTAQVFRIVGEHRIEGGSGWLGPWWRTLSGTSVVLPAQVDAIKLWICGLTLLGLLVEAFVRSRSAFDRRARQLLGRCSNGLLLVASVAAVSAYLNFGAYRSNGFVHEHDVFHYFVGAKYFPQLGYGDLYTCAGVAEAEAGFSQRVALRSQRDLRTNRFIPGPDVLLGRSHCVSLFTRTRWNEFKEDVRYFADAADVPSWHRVVRDHGFNASPLWIATARAIITRLSAGDSAIGGLVAPLDPILLLSGVAIAVWAFGGRAAGVALVVFTCNPLAEFTWVGGGFLRQLWFFAIVLGLSLLRKTRWTAAGAVLASSGLLQLFPFACCAGLGITVLFARLQGRSLPDGLRRSLVGFAAAVVFLVPLSAWASGRAGAWSEFAANTRKHADTPSLNLVGLPTALSFRTATRASSLFDEDATDPFARIREARKRNLSDALPFRVLGAVAGLALLSRWLRREVSLDTAASAGIALVPFVVETSCYYTSWLAVLALATKQRPMLCATVLALVCAQLLLRRIELEGDAMYAAASWLLVAFVSCFLGLGGRGSRTAAAR